MMDWIPNRLVYDPKIFLLPQHVLRQCQPGQHGVLLQNSELLEAWRPAVKERSQVCLIKPVMHLDL